jgi:ABC-2 type transport system ATP-binding protein
MPAENATASPHLEASRYDAADAPLAIEVHDLEKSFRIPTHRVDSLKERAVRPFAARETRELRALDGISFEIRRGEFFGIVGRNGSGKSTLLKLLASIYKPDAGRIRMAGRMAPFIELGVGFNPELTARENILLNGVMMGLTPTQTRERLDDVLDFAELHDFADLKLKNFSSGMLVRLAFSVMLQADAEILLIDEVLAVGDAAFQQKCADAFHQMKDEGKTIVLVTHEMSTVETYCHRAMLVDAGKIRHLGDPAEVGRRYTRLNFEREREHDGGGTPESNERVRILDARVEGPKGERLEAVEHGTEIRLRLDFEAIDELADLNVACMLANADGVGVFQFGAPIEDSAGGRRLRPGQRISFRADLQNPLSPGRYRVHCGVNHGPTHTVLLHLLSCVDFVVFGGRREGIVDLPHRVVAEAVKEGDG